MNRVRLEDLATWRKRTLAQGISLTYLHNNDRRLKGTVALASKSPSTKVRVRYTHDGWRCFVESEAEWNKHSCKSLDDFPSYGFQIDWPESRKDGVVEFALRCRTDGEEKWDNNRNKNYRVYQASTIVCETLSPFRPVSPFESYNFDTSPAKEFESLSGIFPESPNMLPVVPKPFPGMPNLRPEINFNYPCLESDDLAYLPNCSVADLLKPEAYAKDLLNSSSIRAQLREAEEKARKRFEMEVSTTSRPNFIVRKNTPDMSSLLIARKGGECVPGSSRRDEDAENEMALVTCDKMKLSIERGISKYSNMGSVGRLGTSRLHGYMEKEVKAIVTDLLREIINNVHFQVEARIFSHAIPTNTISLDKTDVATTVVCSKNPSLDILKHDKNVLADVTSLLNDMVEEVHRILTHGMYGDISFSKFDVSTSSFRRLGSLKQTFDETLLQVGGVKVDFSRERINAAFLSLDPPLTAVAFVRAIPALTAEVTTTATFQNHESALDDKIIFDDVSLLLNDMVETIVHQPREAEFVSKNQPKSELENVPDVSTGNSKPIVNLPCELVTSMQQSNEKETESEAVATIADFAGKINESAYPDSTPPMFVPSKEGGKTAGRTAAEIEGEIREILSEIVNSVCSKEDNASTITAAATKTKQSIVIAETICSSESPYAEIEIMAPNQIVLEEVATPTLHDVPKMKKSRSRLRRFLRFITTPFRKLRRAMKKRRDFVVVNKSP